MNASRRTAALSARRSLRQGMTLIEMLVVIAILALLASLMLPAFSRARFQARRAACLAHLKEIGHAIHLFALDHDSLYPAAVEDSEGGVLLEATEVQRRGEWFATDALFWKPVSNFLVTPKLLRCPADKDRAEGMRWDQLQNRQISYFMGVTARFQHPGSVLSGDRNLAPRESIGRGASDETSWMWTEGPHRRTGNLLFADGHAERLDASGLAQAMAVALSDPFARGNAGHESNRESASAPNPIVGQTPDTGRSPAGRRTSTSFGNRGRWSGDSSGETTIPATNALGGHSLVAVETLRTESDYVSSPLPAFLHSMRLLAFAGMGLFLLLLLLFLILTIWMRTRMNPETASAEELLRRAGELGLGEDADQDRPHEGRDP